MSLLIDQRDLSSTVILFSFLLCCCVSTTISLGHNYKIDKGYSSEDYCPHTICDGVIEGHFLDNPLNCAAFFQCVNGRANAGECPGGTWFNYEAQLCDAPWHVRCDAEISEIVELKCVENEKPKYTISCRGSQDLHTVRHPYDCNQYYLCVSGLPILRSCAPGLEFNAEENQCMEPESANCHFSVCPPYNLPLTFLPSNTSCSEFSICYYGEAVPRYCADGLHWDQKNNWCTQPEHTHCEIEGSGDSSEEQEGSGEGETESPIIEFHCTKDSPVFNPDPNDCRMYFICDLTGTAHPNRCLDGLYFDFVTSHCTTPELANCYPGSN